MSDEQRRTRKYLNHAEDYEVKASMRGSTTFYSKAFTNWIQIWRRELGRFGWFIQRPINNLVN